MLSNYKRLGNYIQEANIRNKDLSDIPLLGVSIKKVLMPSIANTIGTDMSTYKLISRNQFAYGPVTSRNGDKISIALLDEYEKALLSQAYTVFEVKDTTLLNPEYLIMWFRRPEFDRYARFMSHGSAREIFSWREMCDTLLPIPSIEKQIEIVREYHIIQKRINLNDQLINKLEETAQAVYKQWFVDEIDFENLPEGWRFLNLGELSSIKGGKRLPKGDELNDSKVGRPYIKVADMKKTKFLVLNSKFQYVSDKIHTQISRYIVNTNDIIISIVGTIGMINIIDKSLNNANLTENCMKINNIEFINAKILYHYLNSEIGKRVIEESTVGGVQGKLPLYNIQSMSVLIPNSAGFEKFNSVIELIDSKLNIKVLENQKLEELKELMLAKMTKVETELIL
ncbi:restriction endonuclease subunit S [Flavobacterium sp. MC2016-06]|jgi:type I restriction enzyme S subunit|uniref:restriction endonuclease subunit S n=1 Tax=Flavobacterium sp. MC2016-06 TaxID=2676308 RepID=UPI0012BAE928|nr:restriction endonuclease subunit S [Flavobacterium sp. MC2016-06]MBU3860142.1 restriction endonuclease subunit S [Flavobacterium sp. MC2016-06]